MRLPLLRELQEMEKHFKTNEKYYNKTSHKEERVIKKGGRGGGGSREKNVRNYRK